MWFLLCSFVGFPYEDSKKQKLLEYQRSAKEILEFLFRDEITDEQRQKALDAAVAEDLHRGENGFSFMGNPDENHTSDMESV